MVPLVIREPVGTLALVVILEFPATPVTVESADILASVDILDTVGSQDIPAIQELVVILEYLAIAVLVGIQEFPDIADTQESPVIQAIVGLVTLESQDIVDTLE